MRSDWGKGHYCRRTILRLPYQQELSGTSTLGVILKQTFTRGGILEHIREAFQEAKKEFGGRGLRLPDLVDIMKKAITSLQRVFICIDG